MRILVIVIFSFIPESAFSFISRLQKSNCNTFLHFEDKNVLTLPKVNLPYQLDALNTKINSGDSVDLTLSRIDGKALDFETFFVVAVDSFDGSTFGQFLPTRNTKTVQCLKEGTNGIFFNNSTPLTSLTFKWVSPSVSSEIVKRITFMFTIKKNQEAFWTNQVGKRSVEVANSQITAAHIDYLGCGSTKGCFGISDNCIANGNCQAMLSYNYNNEKEVFELTLHGKDFALDDYLAVGISFDDKMGDDVVFFCIDGKNRIEIGWNSGKTNIKGLQNISLSNNRVKSDNGYLTCDFEISGIINPVPPNDNQTRTFNLLHEEYFILLALGVSDGQGDLQYHQMRLASTKLIDLTSVSVTAEENSDVRLIQIHSSLMVIAWLAMAASAMYVARYHKETVQSYKPMGLDFWFRFHQLFMGLAVTLTLVSLSFVFAAVKLDPFSSYTIKQNPHAIVGSICIICAVIQPFMSLFRCHPGTKYRWIFNWAHWFVGNSAMALAIASIFLAIELPLPNLPEDLSKALIGYLAVKAVAHGIPTLQRLYYSRSNNLAKNKSSFEGDNEKGSVLRNLVGFIYIIFVWAFAIAFAVIIFKSNSIKRDSPRSL